MKNVFVKASFLLATALIISAVFCNTKTYAANLPVIPNPEYISNPNYHNGTYTFSEIKNSYNVIIGKWVHLSSGNSIEIYCSNTISRINADAASTGYTGFDGNNFTGGNGIWNVYNCSDNGLFVKTPGFYTLGINSNAFIIKAKTNYLYNNKTPINTKEYRYAAIKSIKFFNYSNTGARFGLVTDLTDTENENFIFKFKGNLQFKFYPPNLLSSIIEHYEWTDEEDIYNAFKENGQFLINTDYNYFMQKTAPIEYDMLVDEQKETSLGVLGVPQFIDYIGYFPNPAVIIQQIYGIDNTLSDMQILLASFTIYPYIWNNEVYPNSTIIFNWAANDILQSYPTIELPPDWEPTPGVDESTVDIVYTHDDQDYLGRSSDILNAYYKNLPFDMINETTSFLGRVMNIIPSPVRNIIIFFIIAGVITGVVCIARE